MIDHPRARVVIGGVQRFLPPDPEPTVAHANASRRIRAHAGMVRSLLLFGSSGGQVLLVSDSVDGLVRWDPVTGQALMRYTDYDFAVNELAAADLPDGRLVLAAARQDGFGSWDARTGEPLGEWDDPNTIWAVASGTLPDGRALFLGAGNDHLVYRWDAATGKRLGVPLAGHRSS